MSTLKVSTLRNEADSSDVAINRTTSDGDILRFQKDGTTVGRIGVEASDNFYIADNAGNCGINFKGFINPVGNNGETRDAAIDLGNSGGRFKDLYLSGGVYVGGTGSANYLDDYEEGTWTPGIVATTTNPTISYISREGKYTKIGNLVYCSCAINIGTHSGGSGSLFINGFPFAHSSSGISTGALEVAELTMNSGYSYFIMSMFASNSWAYVRQMGSNKDESAVSITNLAADPDWFRFSFVYRTDA